MSRPLGRIVATIEARMTSNRLPGKVLMRSLGRPMLDIMVERVRRSRHIEDIVLCTTTNATDDPVEALCGQLDIGCWRGSEDDVLGRVLGGARAFKIDTIVELTGDCPLIDPALIDKTIEAYAAGTADYCSNQLTDSHPDGTDTQVFASAILEDVASRTDDPIEHEHVSLFIYRHPELYTLLDVPAAEELHWPGLRLCLDTPEDFLLIDAVFSRLYPENPGFSFPDILQLLKREPALRALNADIRPKTV